MRLQFVAQGLQALQAQAFEATAGDHGDDGAGVHAYVIDTGIRSTREFGSASLLIAMQAYMRPFTLSAGEP